MIKRFPKYVGLSIAIFTIAVCTGTIIFGIALKHQRQYQKLAGIDFCKLSLTFNHETFESLHELKSEELTPSKFSDKSITARAKFIRKNEIIRQINNRANEQVRCPHSDLLGENIIIQLGKQNLYEEEDKLMGIIPLVVAGKMILQDNSMHLSLIGNNYPYDEFNRIQTANDMLKKIYLAEECVIINKINEFKESYGQQCHIDLKVIAGDMHEYQETEAGKQFFGMETREVLETFALYDSMLLKMSSPVNTESYEKFFLVSRNTASILLDKYEILLNQKLTKLNKDKVAAQADSEFLFAVSILFFAGIIAYMIILRRSFLKHKHLIEELEHSEKLLFDLLNNAPDAMLGVDDDNKLIFVNKIAERIFNIENKKGIGSDYSQLDISEISAEGIPWPGDIINTKNKDVKKKSCVSCILDLRMNCSGTQSKPHCVKIRTANGSEIIAERSESKVITSAGEIKIISFKDVTEKIRQELKLAELNILLSESQKVAHIGTALYTMKTGQIIFTEEMFNLLGIDKEKPAPNVNELFELVFENEREIVGSIVSKALHESTAVTFTCKVNSGENECRDLELHMLPFRKGNEGVEEWIGICRDISEYVFMKNQIMHRLDMERIVSQISNNLISSPVHDLNSEVTESLGLLAEFTGNDRAYIFNYDQESQSLSNTHEWCNDGISAQIENLQNLNASDFGFFLKPLLKKEHLYISDISLLPDEAANEREILSAQEIKSLLVVPLFTENTLTGFIGFDAVKQKKDWPHADTVLLKMAGDVIQRAMEKANSEKLLHNQNNELKKINSELDRFVYSASHELRAPLSSVLGVVSLLEMDLKNDDELHQVGLIKSSVIRLDEFINEIVQYSRNSRLKVEKAPVDIKKLVQETFNDLRFMPGSEKIRLQLNLDERTPLYSDVTRLRMIFNNLISNAIKYHNTSQSFPFISCNIKINERIAGIEICDNGSGIAREHHKNIFTMFYKESEQSNGSGLGLYIVKEAIEKMNGTIHFESGKGIGTRFLITVPNYSYASQTVII